MLHRCYTAYIHKRHPGGLQNKFVLRNEWGDGKTMLRNKLTQDLFTHLGAAAPRVEYAELSVNGEYFGLYTLEERVDDHFARCRGWPTNDGVSSLGPYCHSQFLMTLLFFSI